MKSKLFIIVCMVFSCGCVATGPKFTEHHNSLKPLPAATARVYVFRTAESAQVGGRSASFKVDGTFIGKCDNKGFNVFAIPSGFHKLSVGLWDSPGSCNLEVRLEPAKEYYFEITARKEFIAAGQEGGLLLGGIGALAAGAVESSGKECGGTFSIQAVETTVAEGKIKDLRLTD